MKKSKSELMAVLGMCVIFLMIGGMASAQDQDKDMNKTYENVDKWIWGKEKPQQPAPQPTAPPVKTEPQQQVQQPSQSTPQPEKTVQEPQSTSQPVVSKESGTFTVTVKKIVVSQKFVYVYLEFLNNGEGCSLFSYDRLLLVDEKGNDFSFLQNKSTPLEVGIDSKKSGSILLVFNRELISSIGNYFSLSFAYTRKHASYNTYYTRNSVEFSDIKALKPQ